MNKTYGTGQIIDVLRQYDVILSEKKSIMEVYRELSISNAPYYKLRKTYVTILENYLNSLLLTIFMERVAPPMLFSEQNCDQR